LFPRSASSNLADFIVSGQVNATQTPYVILRLKLIKSVNGSEEVKETQEQTLNYTNWLIILLCLKVSLTIKRLI
jgi:hypothetical protein